MAKSMKLNAAAGLSGMLKEGHRSYEGIYGAVLRNIEAAKAIAGMVRTSLGPNGMNKLVVNHLEKIIVTSDCASILKELEVQHPAAKMLVLAAQMQEQEFGDMTNFTISLAGELLKNAEDLISNGLHPSEIISGYQRAYEYVNEILPTLVAKQVTDPYDKDQLQEAIRTVLSSKQYGYEDLLSKLVVEAGLITLPPRLPNTTTLPKLNMDSIRIAKLRGGNVTQSLVVKGMVLLRDSEGLIKRAENAKVAVYACGIEAVSTEAKGTVLLKSADELLNYNKSEEKKMEEIIQSIAATGVKIVIANGSISEIALHYLNKYDLMVLKIQSKYELRRICSAIGATASVRLGPLTPEELGEVSLAEVQEIASRKVTVFKQEHNEDTAISTIVLRAATENVMNDLERAVEDGIYSLNTILNHDSRLLAGGGSVELEIAKLLKEQAKKNNTLDQYGIKKFGEAFDIIPRTLAENSGCDSTSMMYFLHQSHLFNKEIDDKVLESEDKKIEVFKNLQENLGATNLKNVSDSDKKFYGFSIDTLKPENMNDLKIYDLYGAKVNALRLAFDATITVLKIDQIVMSKPAGGPKPRSALGPDYD